METITNKDLAHSKIMTDVTSMLINADTLVDYIDQCIKCCDYLLDKLDPRYENTLHSFYNKIKLHKATEKLYNAFYNNINQLKYGYNIKNFINNIENFIKSFYDGVISLAENVCIVDSSSQNKSLLIRCVAFRNALIDIYNNCQGKLSSYYIHDFNIDKTYFIQNKRKEMYGDYKKYFGQLVLEKRIKHDVYTMPKTEPYYLVFADENYVIYGERDKIYIKPLSSQGTYFIPFKELLNKPKSHFTRYSLRADMKYDNDYLGINAFNDQFTYRIRRGKYDQVDVLFELSDGTWVARIWDNNEENYKYSRMFLIQKEHYQNEYISPRFEKGLPEENISLQDIYKDFSSDYWEEKIRSNKQIVKELQNLLSDNSLHYIQKQTVSNALNFWNEINKNKDCDIKSVESEIIL